MWKSSEYCDFTSSWDCDHDPNFLATYTVVQNSEDWNDPGDSYDHPPASFITCSKNAHVCALNISCTCKPHHSVSILGIDITSEVRTIEIYSDAEGYLQTIQGKLQVEYQFNEENGEPICCNVKLEKPVDSLSIKFMGQRSSVRIYNLHFIIAQNHRNSFNIPGQIDMSKVKGYLHSMGDSAPAEGTKLMRAVEDYQQGQRSMFGGLSSVLSSGSSDRLSVLSSLLAAVNTSHDTKPSNHNQQQATYLTNDSQETKSNDSENGGPLADMLMSMSQDTYPGDTLGQGGMFEMLQTICGKVSRLRVADQVDETDTENLKLEAVTETSTTSPRMEVSSETGSSKQDPASSRLTGSHIEMLQMTIEKSVLQMIQSSEETIMKYIDTSLNAMESRLNQKLDNLTKLLQKNAHSVHGSGEETEQEMSRLSVM